MSFEEVSNLFEEYSYTEVNITTGFNLDHLQNIIIERLHRDAKFKLQELIKPPKREYIAEKYVRGSLFIAALLLPYFIFMYFGLMLSDYAFETDKWYWQTLTYILSIILSIVYFLTTMVAPVMYMEF